MVRCSGDGEWDIDRVWRVCREMKKRVEWIDALKGVAILMVAGVHVAQAVPLPAWVRDASTVGAMGVQLFFLMSAYCLCITWHGEQFSWRWVYRKYKRLAIWYLLGIALYWMLAHLHVSPTREESYSPLNIMANLLFVNGFLPTAQNTVVPGGWSISCIALFAFAYPLLYRLESIWLILVGIAGCVASFLCSRYLGWPRFFSYCSPMNQFVVFVIGVCLYRYKEKINTASAVAITFAFFVLSFASVVLLHRWQCTIFFRHILVSVCFAAVGDSTSGCRSRYQTRCGAACPR